MLENRDIPTKVKEAIVILCLQPHLRYPLKEHFLVILSRAARGNLAYPRNKHVRGHCQLGAVAVGLAVERFNRRRIIVNEERLPELVSQNLLLLVTKVIAPPQLATLRAETFNSLSVRYPWKRQ